MEELLVPFAYEYMVKAMAVSAFVGLVCGLLSCFLTLKGWSLTGDALAHAIVPGVAIAHLSGLPMAAGAMVAALLASGGMFFLKQKTILRADAVIGVVFTAFFALGLLLVSLRPAGVSMKTILFGNVLGILDADIIQVGIIGLVTLLLIAARWRDLVLVFFDEGQARAVGLSPEFWNAVFFTLLAACTVAALQTVGATLVVAMVIVPGATAYLLVDRFGPFLLLAGGLGAFCGAAGAYASYFLNGSTGGCIVVLQCAIFLLAFIFGPKHGWLGRRRAARSTSITEGGPQ
ncbi:MAG: metal ABC transporter permease [Verrucomicrobiales bacterium]